MGWGDRTLPCTDMCGVLAHIGVPDPCMMMMRRSEMHWFGAVAHICFHRDAANRNNKNHTYTNIYVYYKLYIYKPESLKPIYYVINLQI